MELELKRTALILTSSVSNLKRLWVCRLQFEALPLNDVIMVCKRWSCRGWQLISQHWHKSAANENYSGWFVLPCSAAHKQTDAAGAHTREENTDEHKGQSGAELSGGGQEVNRKQWNISELSAPRHPPRRPIYTHNDQIIPLFTNLCWHLHMFTSIYNIYEYLLTYIGQTHTFTNNIYVPYFPHHLIMHIVNE